MLLGRVPGHGIPVWVRSNPFTEGGQNLIDLKVIDQVNKTNINSDFFDKYLKIFPYREIDGVMLDLPGDDIWRNKGFDPDSPRFEGIGVFSDDPVWLYAAKNTNSDINSNIPIVCNKSIMEKYFDYDKYKKNLSNKLPEPLFNDLPDEKDFFSSKNSIIWLKIGADNELLRLKVIFLEQIPLPGKIAYLFPLKLYHALEKAHHYSNITFFPESFYNNKIRRIKQIHMKRNMDDDKKNDFSKCLNCPITKKRSQTYLEFENPKPEYYVQACAKQLNIEDKDYRIAAPVYSDLISHDKKYYINLPCKRLPEGELNSIEGKQCKTKPGYQIEREISGFTRAFVYVHDRDDLSNAVSSLKNLDRKPLLIPWIYSDALKRFGALIKMFDLLATPYAILFCIFLSALLGVYIASLVGHRRHNYGIFIAKGMKRIHIYFMLCFQVSLAMFLGILIAASIIFGICKYLSNKLIIAALEFKDVLTLDSSELLPVGFFDYLLVFFVTISVAWFFTVILLFFMPLRRKTMPDKLLHE